MNLLNIFKRLPSLSPAEVREYIKRKQPGEYCLVDVRTPAEFEQSHLPGALLIPLSNLGMRMEQLNDDKPLILYCRSGNRSRLAARLLLAAGFKNVFNMDGGLLNYKS